MSVGDTKGKQVEQIIKDKKPKVSPARVRMSRRVVFEVVERGKMEGDESP